MDDESHLFDYCDGLCHVAAVFSVEEYCCFAHYSFNVISRTAKTTPIEFDRSPLSAVILLLLLLISL